MDVELEFIALMKNAIICLKSHVIRAYRLGTKVCVMYAISNQWALKYLRESNTKKLGRCFDLFLYSFHIFVYIY